MKNNTEQIVVIAGSARDTVISFPSKTTRIGRGGPAFWITSTLQKLQYKYRLYTNKKGRVYLIVKAGEETGAATDLPKIILPPHAKSDVFIVSTIGDELPLKSLIKLNGGIAVDIQGYARMAASKIALPKNLTRKIVILKATRRELAKLPTRIVRQQKNKRILIVTQGSKGFRIYAQGKKYVFSASRVTAPNTIGAGDVLLASFVVQFLRTKNVGQAGLFAKNYVTKFLKQKYAENR